MATVLAEPDREFEELYRRYAAEVQRYALAVSQNEVDAEDVTQQTFMNAYRALVRGEQPRAPQHWLIAIAHNVYRERLRRSSRRPTEVALDDNLRAVASDESRWSAEEIRHALSHLCGKQRAVILLRELEGRPYAEIAETLGLSQSATEALAFRARRALREQLESEVTCDQALTAVGRGLDGALSPPEHRALRAHLRACESCAGVARSRRGRRRRIGGLALLPFPLPLKSLFGGGSASAGAASAGGGVAVKAAAVAAAGVVATGVGYETVGHTPLHATGPLRASVVGHAHRVSVAHRATRTRRQAPVQTAPIAMRRVETPRPKPAADHPPRAKRHSVEAKPQGRLQPAALAAQARPQPTPREDAPDAQAPSSQSAANHEHGKPHVVGRQKPRPVKHDRVEKVKHHGRATPPPDQSKAGHDDAAGKGYGAHGNGNGGKNHATAAAPNSTEPLPPAPPGQARKGGSDG